VVTQEDSVQRRYPVAYWNDSLCRILGFNFSQLRRAREAAVRHGWLKYHQGKRGVAATYSVIIPDKVKGFDGACCEVEDEEVVTNSDTNSDTIMATMRPQCDNNLATMRQQSGHNVTNILPIPIPSPIPNPSMDASEQDLFGPVSGKTTEPIPGLVNAPTDLPPRLRETWIEIVAADGHEVANRALAAGRRLFKSPSPAQLLETWKAASSAKRLNDPQELWPDFRERIKADQIRSKTPGGLQSTEEGQEAARIHQSRAIHITVGGKQK
jgi:hypothetical protein